MKLIKLIKVCRNEPYNRDRVGKHLSDMSPFRNILKKGEALLPQLINCAINYVIWRVQVNQDGLKLNGTRQLLFYTDDVNMLGGSAHTLKKNTEVLLEGSKEIGLEVNADKTMYMVMSRDKNAGRSHNIKVDNSSFESVEDLKYLGTTLTNQNFIQEEIKS